MGSEYNIFQEWVNWVFHNFFVQLKINYINKNTRQEIKREKERHPLSSIGIGTKNKNY